VLPDPNRVCYLTQTTLSLDETRDIVTRLKQRFPAISEPPAQDICYATENRQMAVKAVATACDLLLVVGSNNSSNSKRLVEVGENSGVRSYLINDRTEIDLAWLECVRSVAVTAGASAPEHLVGELIDFLRSHGFHSLEEIELVDEDVRFSLPGELSRAASQLTTISLQ
jgi:4-hydroxy-3-methylbut-2-enyl diphosphate reductase